MTHSAVPGKMLGPRDKIGIKASPYLEDADVVREQYVQVTIIRFCRS